MKQSIKQLLASSEYGKEITLQAWVRNRRGSSNVAFIHLNDGSCIQNIQVVAEVANFEENIIKKIQVGACIGVKGELVASKGSEQASEILAKKIEIIGVLGKLVFETIS